MPLCAKSVGCLCAALAFVHSQARADVYCQPGLWVLTFKGRTAQLEKQNETILDNFALQAPYCGERVVIDAYPSPHGAAADGYKRATLALAYLVGHGIAASEISLQFHSERHLPTLRGDEWDVGITWSPDLKATGDVR